jgi:hypothetical protein
VGLTTPPRVLEPVEKKKDYGTPAGNNKEGNGGVQWLPFLLCAPEVMGSGVGALTN